MSILRSRNSSSRAIYDIVPCQRFPASFSDEAVTFLLFDDGVPEETEVKDLDSCEGWGGGSLRRGGAGVGRAAGAGEIEEETSAGDGDVDAAF